MDGTWGLKTEHHAQSLKFADRAAKEMEAAAPDTFMTDCTQSALQIEAVRGTKPAHPLSLLREAYGLPEER
jgi:Fe-S oxidoreductase